MRCEQATYSLKHSVPPDVSDSLLTLCEANYMLSSAWQASDKSNCSRVGSYCCGNRFGGIFTTTRGAALDNRFR